MTNTPLGPGREFDAIRSILARLGANAQNTGDDAAVLSAGNGTNIVVSTDTSVENVHFRRDWMTAAEIGWRATMSALSDLAAMGAKPFGLLTAIGVPDNWRAELDDIASGIGAAAARAQCPVVGGDLSRASELTLGVTVLGTTNAPLLRSGARPGDALWVTGRLGGPALALRDWLASRTPGPAARERFVHPDARISAGLWFAENGCSAAIDISDGLVADARHLAAASASTATIALESVPCFDGVTAVDAASGGEEYELLVAAPDSLDAARFEREVGIPIARIGRVEAGAGVVVVTSGGVRVEFAGGYDHFSA